MNKHYEVIIIGAGPSGLGAALYLLKNGIKDILVIEQKSFQDTNVVLDILRIKPKRNMNLLV